MTKPFITSFGRIPLAAATLVLIAMLPARGDELPSKEYQVKAAYLFNFTKFVDWPPKSFANASAPIVIGILGDDPFGPLLDGLVKGETVHNRKLTVIRARQIDDLKSCQIVFVGKSEESHIPQILAALGDASILTVGETEGFAKRGGIVNFYLDENKVRFEINRDAARKHGLNISSRLLSLAKIVD